MAIEYIFEIATDLSPRQVIEYFAQRMDCTVEDDNFARRGSEMHLLVSTSPASDMEEELEIFGDVDLTNLTFRTARVGDEETRQDDFIAMVTSVLAFLHDHSDSSGILAYQGELILLQRLTNEQVTFDVVWKEFARSEDDPRLDDIAEPYVTRELDQPFM